VGGGWQVSFAGPGRGLGGKVEPRANWGSEGFGHSERSGSRPGVMVVGMQDLFSLHSRSRGGDSVMSPADSAINGGSCFG